jgi:hypothetical protein
MPDVPNAIFPQVSLVQLAAMAHVPNAVEILRASKSSTPLPNE